MAYSPTACMRAPIAAILSSIICATTMVSDVDAQSGNRVDTVSRNIRGIVTDTARAPIPNVEVILERSSGGSAASQTGRAVSSASGEFLIQGLTPGPGKLNIRRLGYVARSLEVVVAADAGTGPLEVVLQPASFRLDTVRVEAASTGAIPEIVGRQRRRGSGHFVSRSDIERRRQAYVSDVLRSVPGVSVRASSGIGNVVRLRGCRPAIFMDGVQALNAELDEMARPSDIEGIEIYSSWAGVPPQYVDRSGRYCGAILVWTRRR